MNTKEKNVFQGFKMAVTHSQQCQSRFSIKAILRFSLLFCLFLWVIMAAYLPAAYSYSEVSPHWNHIRTQLTDFRTIYIADDVERASQYDWGARHYDVIMGDGVVRNDTVYEYKRRNPGLKWYAYATNWTFMLINADYVTTAWYIHMQNWYSNHPEYNIEDAFIHDANVCPQGTLKTEACRIRLHIWDSDRFVIYPADPGLQAYQAQRMSDIIAANTYNGYEPDGVFFDEHASWDIDDARLRNYNIREYTGETDQPGAYMNDIVGLLQIEKNALGPNKLIILNTSQLTRESDFQMIMAAGSGFLELMNYPLIDGLSNRWDWVDRILSNGASATFSFPNYSIPANYTPGNSASGNARFELAALASHYMVVPNQPDNLTYQRDRLFVPFEQLWYTAIETEIGSPLGPRSIYTEGTDPNGWNYRVWARNFGNALVLVRPIAAWNYQTFDNTTGVTITLPSGDTYIPLNSDGTFGAPISSITLRNAEAAILIKQGSLSPQLQFSSATYDVSEAGTTATITVTRTGSSTGVVTVDYATSNGTATAGSDYTATSGTLSWADGDAAAKSFTITITNDTTVESSETVNIALSNPNGAQISGTNPVVLTISDNDSTGGNGGNNGGDGSASGGSGCGFVKNNGKGQKAKGDGLSFAIMLIIILGGITMIRKLSINYVFNQLQALRRHFIKHTIALFLIGAFLGFFPALSLAATYYVSPTGTAQWPACTDISTPCTAKTAMENAIAGDIVYFRGGVYNPIDDPVQQWLDTPVQFRYQLPVWNPKNSGTEGNPITFMAYHGETPEILDAPDSAVLGAYRRDYIVLDGFRATLIDEDPLSNDTHLVSQLIRFDESLHSVIRNCDFKGTKFGRHTNNSLITIQRSHYMLIEGNKLHDNNGLQDTDPEFKEYAVNTNAIINFWSSDIVIRNNDIYNNYIGIWDKGAERNNQYYHNHIWGGSDYYTSCKQGIYMRATLNVQGPATGVRAYQNVIRNCGVGVQIEDVSYHDFPEVRVYNNTILGNDSYHNNAGVFVADNARYAEIFNNIIVGYPVQVRYYTGASTIVSYSNYNDFYSSSANKRWAINWSNDYSTIDLWRAATNLDINSIESNPQFINPGGANPADYKLQANSPARIGRGGSYATVMGAFIADNETIGYDPDAPRVEITSPPNSTVTTTNTSITISGTATDTLGIVSVTWNNDRGGSGTAWSGTATQNVNWTVSNIPLQSGQNIITVTATDGDDKTGVDVLIVNPTISNSGNTGGSGGGDSTSSGSGCGIIRGSDGKGTGSGLKAIDIGIASLLLLMLFYKLRKLYKINFWIVFVFFIIDITIANNVEAATLEVGAGKAYSTIQAATNVANAGDTILVFPGTYNERISLPSGKTGTAGNKIIFKSQTSRAAFMNGFDTGNANYLRIEGFDISYNVGGWYGGGIWINNSSYVDIVDNYFHDIPGQAINPNWSSGVTHNNIYVANNKIYRVNQGIIARGNDWLVENNDIERLVGTFYDADYTRFFGENITFRNNYFHGTTWQEICPAGLTSFDSSLCSHTDGFQTFAVNPGEYFKNVIIEGNIIRGDWYSQGIMLEGKAGTADNLIVRNNIFADAASWGIAAHGIANLQVLNNNFVNMLIHGVGFRAASDGTPTTGVVQNNIFYNGGTNYWKETACTGCTLTGGYNIITIEKHPYYKESTDLIGVDPLFVNAIGYDFHLQSGSPAKDKGIALSGFATDKDGIVRPQGSAWDIGAYEYCASGSCLGGGSVPPPLDGNTGGSGGDASSSGGSGCGFVRDENGKGQGAKGEGLPFAIMLIITLCLLPIARRLFKAFNRPVL